MSGLKGRVVPTRLWIDTEFNSYQGELISIALVDGFGLKFYMAMWCEDPHPWVAQNVLPVIGVEPAPKVVIQAALECWLAQFEAVHLVADWPEDISHFCQLLITGPGVRLSTPPLTMEVRRDLDAVSDVPHNALWDARAMRDKHLLIEFAEAAQKGLS